MWAAAVTRDAGRSGGRREPVAGVRHPGVRGSRRARDDRASREFIALAVVLFISVALLVALYIPILWRGDAYSPPAEAAAVFGGVISVIVGWMIRKAQ